MMNGKKYSRIGLTVRKWTREGKKEKKKWSLEGTVRSSEMKCQWVIPEEFLTTWGHWTEIWVALNKRNTRVWRVGQNIDENAMLPLKCFIQRAIPFVLFGLFFVSKRRKDSVAVTSEETMTGTDNRRRWEGFRLASRLGRSGRRLGHGHGTGINTGYDDH